MWNRAEYCMAPNGNGTIEIYGKTILFLGALGSGMLPLFCLCRDLGANVYGYDRCAENVDPAHFGLITNSESVRDETDIAVYSLAFGKDHPMMQKVRKMGVRAISRAAFLGNVMKMYGERIGVSGSHGKSTVTSMLSFVFEMARRSPTVICGAEMPSGGNYLQGDRDTLIYEACEYRDAFLSFSPTVGVYLNLELDHVDYFADIDALRSSFKKSIDGAGLAVVNRDDPNLSELINKRGDGLVTFGMSSGSDYRAINVKTKFGKCSFTVERRGKPIADIHLSVIGDFNLYNALAAFTVATEMGIAPTLSSAALSDFVGAGRRLQLIGHINSRPIIYDYAHHPTEISKGIKAIREAYGSPVTVIFKPHTFSRTQALYDGFVSSLSEADLVLLFDISGIREDPIEGVSSASLAKDIGNKSAKITAGELLFHIDGGNGPIAVMGAADMEEVKTILLKTKNK